MSLGLVSFQFRMLCHPPLSRSDPVWPALSELSPAKARVFPLSRVPGAPQPAALRRHAAADKSSARHAPRLPPSPASESKPAAGDLLPSSPGPSRPRFRCQPQAETRSTTAKPGLHTDALTATRTVLAGPDRIPTPPRR